MFSQKFNSYVCIGDFITCEVEGFKAIARVQHDPVSRAPDKEIGGFWPSLDPKSEGFIGSDKTQADLDIAMAKANNVMEAWKNNEWYWCGITVTIYRKGVELASSSLWSIECNYPESDNSYLLECANELLQDAIELAKEKLQELVSDIVVKD